MKLDAIDLASTEGRLDRRLQTSGWLAPGTIEIVGDTLHWRHFDHAGQFGHRVRQSRLLLQEFCALADADNTAIAEFARKWGVLGLCAHGLPQFHNAPEFYGQPFRCDLIRSTDGAGFEEPLARWRYFARRARAILAIGAHLRHGRPGKAADWDTVFAEYRLDTIERFWETRPRAFKGQRVILGEVLQEWLRLGNIAPEILWNDAASKPSFRVATAHLFGTLGLQMLLAISDIDGLATCHHCSKPFVPPHRAPKHGQRPFCPVCRANGQPQRYALADFRRRKADAGRAEKP